MRGVWHYSASGRFRGSKRGPQDACRARRNRPCKGDIAQQGPAHCPANTSEASAANLKGLEASWRSTGCPLASGCAHGAGASPANEHSMPAAHRHGTPQRRALYGRAARTDHRRIAAHRRDGAQHECDDVRKRGELGRQGQRRHDDEQRVRLRPACGPLSTHRARSSPALPTEPHGSSTEVASAACWCNQAKGFSSKRRWGVLSSLPSVSLNGILDSLLSVQSAWRRMQYATQCASAHSHASLGSHVPGVAAPGARLQPKHDAGEERARIGAPEARAGLCRWQPSRPARRCGEVRASGAAACTCAPRRRLSGSAVRRTQGRAAGSCCLR